MVMERKARLKGDEWARVWTYEAARVEREGEFMYQPPKDLCVIYALNRI